MSGYGSAAPADPEFGGYASGPVGHRGPGSQSPVLHGSGAPIPTGAPRSFGPEGLEQGTKHMRTGEVAPTPAGPVAATPPGLPVGPEVISGLMKMMQEMKLQIDGIQRQAATDTPTPGDGPDKPSSKNTKTGHDAKGSFYIGGHAPGDSGFGDSGVMKSRLDPKHFARIDTFAGEVKTYRTWKFDIFVALGQLDRRLSEELSQLLARKDHWEAANC